MQFKFLLLLLKKLPQIKVKSFTRFRLLRYIITELVIYFLICFCFFFMAFFINQILLQIKGLLANHAPLLPVIKVMLYCMPTVVFQTVPYATLVGFLMALGRMTCDNEILIFRATGHNYVFLLTPVLLLALSICICSFMINDCLIPWGIIKMRQTIVEIANSNPAVQLEANSVKLFSNIAIVCGDVQDTDISDIIFIDKSSNTKVISAGATHSVPQKQTGVLMRFSMKDATILATKDSPKDCDFLTSKVATLNIFNSVIPYSQVYIRPQDMTSRDLHEKIVELSARDDLDPRIVNQFRIEFMNKFSFPFAALFFAAFAMPVAIIVGKANGQTNGLIIGVIVSAVYWTAWVSLKSMGIRLGLNPILTMWSPNVAILLISLFLYTRLAQK